jgi:hypothetical protein
MVPIKYQVVGEEDYALVITIDELGEYVVESGSYTSQPPRKGTLTDQQRAQLVAAIKDLGVPREHPMPAGAEAFEAQLTVGRPGQQANYVFWEGALEEDEKLRSLVRQLELL